MDIANFSLISDIVEVSLYSILWACACQHAICPARYYSIVFIVQPKHQRTYHKIVQSLTSNCFSSHGALEKFKCTYMTRDL